MFAKRYYEIEDKQQRMQMIHKIKETESQLFDDIKDIVKAYIKNNINQESLNIQKNAHKKITSSGIFREGDLQMNYTCLLDLKAVEDKDFDRKYAQFVEQKQQLPQIQANILKNIKEFVESEDYVRGYYFIKDKYNLTDDKDIINKMRQKIYNKIKGI